MIKVDELTVINVSNECQLFVYQIDNTVYYSKIYLN
jgi:hypothetical protein